MAEHDAAARTGRKLDRWGLRPSRPGTVRGKVSNIRRTRTEAAFGEMEIIDFDLFMGEGEPTVPVQMRGNDFSNQLWPEWLADVPDPDPTVRPIVARRITFPASDREEGELISYYPGRDGPDPRRDRLFGATLIIGPLVGGSALAALIVWYFHLL